MKKTYIKPQVDTCIVELDVEISKKSFGEPGTGNIHAKDRDDETEGGDSPIWGEDGKLW